MKCFFFEAVKIPFEMFLAVNPICPEFAQTDDTHCVISNNFYILYEMYSYIL